MIGMYSVFKSKTRHKDVRNCNMSLHLHEYTYMYIYTIYIYAYKYWNVFQCNWGFFSCKNIFRDKFSIEDCKFESVCLTKLVWCDHLAYLERCLVHHLVCRLCLQPNVFLPGIDGKNTRTFSKITYFNLVLQEKRFSMFVIF